MESHLDETNPRGTLHPRIVRAKTRKMKKNISKKMKMMKRIAST